MKKIGFYLTLIFLVFFCFAFDGFAEEVNFGDRVPDVDEITKALEPKYSKTRSIRPVPVKKPQAISMEITFEKNSYELTSKAKKILDAVGASLNRDTLSQYRFTIEGHTDASGDDAYNLNLSKQRAKTVVNYLVTAHNIDKDRLKTVGRGEDELLIKDAPYDPRNRRVRIINTGN